MNNVKLCLFFIIKSILLSFSTAGSTCPDGYVSYDNSCAECGITYKEPNVKIVGGVNAIPNSWPSVALIIQRYAGYHIIDKTKQLMVVMFECSGTLINSFTILTAASCISENFFYNGSFYKMNFESNPFYSTLKETFKIYLGVHNASFVNNYGQIPPPPAAIYRVIDIIVHPDFDKVILLNDIALMILSSEVNFTTAIQPACVPSFSTNYPNENTVSYAAGWGELSYDGDIPDLLNNVNLTIYNMASCEKVFSLFYKSPTSQICAGEILGGKDTCIGDGGSGLYVLNTIGNKLRHEVCGLVSYGYSCAKPGYPSIYTRISFFTDWIKNNWKETTTTTSASTTATKTTTTTTTTTTNKSTSSIEIAESTNIINSVQNNATTMNDNNKSILGLAIGLSLCLFVAILVLSLIGLFICNKFRKNNLFSKIFLKTKAEKNQTPNSQLNRNPDDVNPRVTINNFFIPPIPPQNTETLPFNVISFLPSISQVKNDKSGVLDNNLNNELDNAKKNQDTQVNMINDESSRNKTKQERDKEDFH